MRRSRAVVRMLAAAGAVALVGAAAPAHAATEYDGEATALRIEGLRLELLPGGTASLPAELQPLVQQLTALQAELPEQLRRDSLTIAVPNQVVGHAEYPGIGTEGEIPPNPLITGSVLEAKSVKTDDGDVLSAAGIEHLSLAGGVLGADVIRASCLGTGDEITLEVTQARLSSTEGIVDGEITLERGTPRRIEGLGTITFNQQQTDGRTAGSATNLVIDLDTDLSLRALERTFDTTFPTVERAVKDVLIDAGKTEVGGQAPLAEVLNEETVRALSGQQVYTQLDRAVEQAAGPLAEQLGEMQDALNDIAHLDGTITIASAECSQQVTTEPTQPEPKQRVEPVAGNASGPPEPPLADTGSPVGMMGAGLAGLLALAGGGWALLRTRR